MSAADLVTKAAAEHLETARRRLEAAEAAGRRTADEQQRLAVAEQIAAGHCSHVVLVSIDVHRGTDHGEVHHLHEVLALVDRLTRAHPDPARYVVSYETSTWEGEGELSVSARRAVVEHGLRIPLGAGVPGGAAGFDEVIQYLLDYGQEIVTDATAALQA